jgi:hypothetical protein
MIGVKLSSQMRVKSIDFLKWCWVQEAGKLSMQIVSQTIKHNIGGIMV